MTKKYKDKGYYLGIALLALGLVMLGNGAVAQNVLRVPVEFVLSGNGDDLGAFTALDSATSFTDIDITNDLKVQQESELQATTTIQELSYGSRFRKALTFTAAATTTPGGLVSLQNTGETRICSRAELDLSTAGGADSTNLTFVLATSTAASAWSGSGTGIIASTTLATNTIDVLNSIDDVGTAAEDSWIWGNGVYLLGAFEDTAISSPGGGGASFASSTAYTSMAGTLYVSCHQR